MIYSVYYSILKPIPKKHTHSPTSSGPHAMGEVASTTVIMTEAQKRIENPILKKALRLSNGLLLKEFYIN
jgi:hypothetical protein